MLNQPSGHPAARRSSPVGVVAIRLVRALQFGTAELSYVQTSSLPGGNLPGNWNKDHLRESTVADSSICPSGDR